MRGIFLFILAFCIVGTVQAEIVDDNLLTSATGIPDIPSEERAYDNLLYPRIIGAGIFGLEFIAVPALHLFLKGTEVRWANPMANVRETEPYIQDNIWHFAGAAASTELNYLILQRYFSLENPALEAGALSVLFWTMMECFDGLGVGFSFHDQISNVLGAGFGVLKLYYPHVPLYVRIGVEDWGRFVMFVGSGFDIEKIDTDYYSFLKTELIYLFDNHLYAGLSSVKGRGRNNYSDHFGITVGYDFSSMIEQKYDSWWARTIGFFGNHMTLSIGVTYWFDDIKFKL